MALSTEQKNAKNEIIRYGIKNGHSNRDIQLAVNIAYIESSFNKNAKSSDSKSTAKGLFGYNVNNWKDRHSNLDRDNANDQISAIYDDINNYSNRYDNLSDQQKSGLTRDEYIYIKHHDGTNVTKFGMNESLGRRIYNNSLTNADPKDLSAFGYIDEIYDLGRNREYSYSWGENSDYGNWLHTINRDGIFYQYDPLALDLNGNGIEPLAADGHAGAMFDHERNGIRTATGWVHSNDGILVYDRNGDGKINNGGELFGDNTLLKDGSTAAHGFAALAELDENSDGKVDAADSAFKKLGVWRDLNHNGISEEGEISSLEDVRVQSLNLAYKNADQNLGNGNTLAEVGSYTDADGNEHIMGDLQLSADRFHSRFSDSIELTDAQRREVNLGGSGRVRNLREAAAQSSELADALQQYKNAETKEEQLALRDKLLQAWANTDKSRDSIIKISADFAIHTQQDRRRGIGLTPSQIRHMQSIMSRNIWELIGESDPDGKRQAELYRRIGVLDSFTGTRSSRLYYFNEAQAKHIIDTVNGTYDKLADSLYDGLLFQTRLRPYLDAMRLRISEEGKYSIDYGDVSALFAEIHKKNPGKAFTDLGELLAKGNADGKNTDLAPLAEKFVQYAQEASNNGTFEAYSNTLGKEALATLGHSLGTDNDDTLRGNHGANYLVGNKGNDSLYGYEGKDILDGGKGDDYMEGGDFGSDIYVFRAGHGKDTVAEKAYEDKDADTLRFEGAKAADARFSREGRDLVINAYGGSNDRVSLTNYFYSDDYRRFHFQFDGQTLGMADIAKQAFEFSGSASGDYIDGWVGNDTIHGLEGDDSISGRDGDDTLDGGAGNDRLFGENGNDTLNGGAGNDDLSGGDGDDHLNGGAGDDTLKGEAGHDTMNGGAGDDYMEGGDFGSDTYVFQAGHGKDTVAEKAYEDKDADILRFAGAKAADARFSREGSNLVVNAYGGSNDRVSLTNYFYSDDYQRFDFHFDDATFKAAELRGIDLPTQGLKAPVDAATQSADTQTKTAVPAEENAPTASTTDDKKAETNAQNPLVVAEPARPAPQKMIAETASNTLQANADVVSGESTAAADTPANVVAAAAETAQPAENGAAASTAKNAAITAKPATALVPVAASTKIQPATVAADTQQTPAAAASASGDSLATASQKTSLATVQQNATALADALKAGGTTAAAASALDANAARQSQQMLSAMAAQGQTATPTALAAPDLQTKPQLVASQV